MYNAILNQNHSSLDCLLSSSNLYSFPEDEGCLNSPVPWEALIPLLPRSWFKRAGSFLVPTGWWNEPLIPFTYVVITFPVLVVVVIGNAFPKFCCLS